MILPFQSNDSPFSFDWIDSPNRNAVSWPLIRRFVVLDTPSRWCPSAGLKVGRIQQGSFRVTHAYFRLRLPYCAITQGYWKIVPPKAKKQAILLKFQIIFLPLTYRSKALPLENTSNIEKKYKQYWKKFPFCLVFCSLIRTFASALCDEVLTMKRQQACRPRKSYW